MIMTDDLSFVTERIPGYADYADERARSDSDMRVRAYVGERLADTQARLAGALDLETTKALEDVLLRCMFFDQIFVRKIEHARLDAAKISALVRSDRRLIELADRAVAVTATELRALVVDLDKQFEYRRSPPAVDA